MNNRRSSIEIIADMLRLGEAGKTEFEELSNQLKGLEKDLASESNRREAKIKWK